MLVKRGSLMDQQNWSGEYERPLSKSDYDDTFPVFTNEFSFCSCGLLAFACKQVYETENLDFGSNVCLVLPNGTPKSGSIVPMVLFIR